MQKTSFGATISRNAWRPPFASTAPIQSSSSKPLQQPPTHNWIRGISITHQPHASNRCLRNLSLIPPSLKIVGKHFQFFCCGGELPNRGAHFLASTLEEGRSRLIKVAGWWLDFGGACKRGSKYHVLGTKYILACIQTVWYCILARIGPSAHGPGGLCCLCAVGSRLERNLSIKANTWERWKPYRPSLGHPTEQTLWLYVFVLSGGWLEACFLSPYWGPFDRTFFDIIL